MERLIKFRAWDSISNVLYPWSIVQKAPIQSYIALDHYTVDQYTGFNDINGKDIYDGDILSYQDEESHHLIYWDKEQGRWMDKRLEDGDSTTLYEDFDFITDCKIIGNRYENPKLLVDHKMLKT